LNICARVLCALIKHAEYASFGQSERALYHSYFIRGIEKGPSVTLQENELIQSWSFSGILE